jgi:hypothetical protein
MRRAGRAALVLSVALPATAHATEPHWSQWRGPDGQGVSRETAGMSGRYVAASGSWSARCSSQPDLSAQIVR